MEIKVSIPGLGLRRSGEGGEKAKRLDFGDERETETMMLGTDCEITVLSSIKWTGGNENKCNWCR